MTCLETQIPNLETHHFQVLLLLVSEKGYSNDTFVFSLNTNFFKCHGFHDAFNPQHPSARGDNLAICAMAAWFDGVVNNKNRWFLVGSGSFLLDHLGVLTG